MVDARHIDLIVQLALARAAQSDEWSARSLGPIHLIKFLYLADLAFAERNGGKTFTGIPWRFVHFGPFATEANDRISPAAAAINAVKASFASERSEKEAVRYTLSVSDAEEVQRRAERELPSAVISVVKKCVHEFGADTGGLLEAVYRTSPMRRAAPGELLDFSSLASASMSSTASPVPEISRRKEKKLDEALARAREQYRAIRAKNATATVTPHQPPRYDEVFQAGTEWLERSDAPEQLEGTVEFPDDIWKSAWRDPDDE